MKTLSTKVERDYNGYSRYRLDIELRPTAYVRKWKVRAVHADGDHAKTRSSYSVVVDDFRSQRQAGVRSPVLDHAVLGLAHSLGRRRAPREIRIRVQLRTIC